MRGYAGCWILLVVFSISADDLASAQSIVARYVPATPAYRWPLIERLTGTETWIKHENHTPTGAFKVRGGLTFAAQHLASGDRRGLISASRGNHSQSLAYAGTVHDLPVTIVVPEGNSPDKNAATEAFGARVIVHGDDFQAALEHSRKLAETDDLVAVPPFHPWLVHGVATYAAELHASVADLDVIYVPIGMGSGACANIAVRDLLGLDTEIVGVVAEQAPAYALSFHAGHPVATEAADTFVDGVACRTPDPAAVEAIAAGAARVVEVSESQAADAVALHYRATHNLAEPAGALALAAAINERDRNQDRRVGLIQTGGNADFSVLRAAFAGTER